MDTHTINTYQIEGIIVNKNFLDEYNNLKKENLELRSKILELSKQDEILRETIKIGEHTIDALKKENEELKSELNKLRQNIDILMNESLERKIKKLSKFYIIALQDINKTMQLEISNKNTDFEKTLKNLRKYRNAQCHIIDIDEDMDTKYKKITYLYEKIKNLDTNVKNNINKKYPYIIDNVILCIETSLKTTYTISDDIKNEIDEMIDEFML